MDRDDLPSVRRDGSDVLPRGGGVPRGSTPGPVPAVGRWYEWHGYRAHLQYAADGLYSVTIYLNNPRGLPTYRYVKGEGDTPERAWTGAVSLLLAEERKAHEPDTDPQVEPGPHATPDAAPE